MAFPSVTNVDGSNPGPNSANLPDTVQMPTGNIWKVGVFPLSLTPASVATITAPVQAFAATGIGLLVGDTVQVGYGSLTPTAGVAMCTAFVSAADTLSIQYVNPTAGPLTPPAGLYTVTVFRVQPNWTAPAVAPLLDW